MRTWITVATLSFSVAACQESPKAQAEAAAPASPKEQPVAAPAPPDKPGVVQPEVREEAFVVHAIAPPTAKTGTPFDFKVTLEAQAGYKVNPEYPIKFTFDSGASFSAEPSVLRKEQATVEGKKAELKGAVQLSGPGSTVVSGKLSFSVCTDDRCLIEKRDLSVSVVGS